MNTRILPVIFATLAFWPVLKWYLTRVFDCSDEPLGILALVTALAFAIIGKEGQAGQSGPSDSSDFFWIVPTILVGLYALLINGAPNLVLAIIMVLTFWSVLRQGTSSQAWVNKCPPATLGLLLLALPVVASLNFYLAYPLRLAVAYMVMAVLKLYGFSPALMGSSIILNGHQVDIDGPCAGVHFLWFAAYLSLFLACLKRASLSRIIYSLMLAEISALLGNVIRALSLSLLWAMGFSTVADNTWVHQGVGTVAFLIVCLLIILSFKVHCKETVNNESVLLDAGVKYQPASQRHSGRAGILQYGYCLLCVIAAVAPFLPGRASPPDLAVQPPDLRLVGIDPKRLMALPLSLREKTFQQNFPGSISKFSDGQCQIVLRTVQSPTRQLHPAADCLRGAGYKIGPQLIEADANGDTWNTLYAEKDDETLRVKERIVDSKGKSWTAISDWYWAAALGQSRGPWLAITKVWAVTPVKISEKEPL